jgi:hypothetical protein
MQVHPGAAAGTGWAHPEGAAPLYQQQFNPAEYYAQQQQQLQVQVQQGAAAPGFQQQHQQQLSGPPIVKAKPKSAASSAAKLSEKLVAAALTAGLLKKRDERGRFYRKEHLAAWAKLLYERGQVSTHGMPAVTPEAAAAAAAEQDAAMSAGTAEWPLPPWMQPQEAALPAGVQAAVPARPASAPAALKASGQGTKAASVKKGSNTGASMGKKAQPAVLVGSRCCHGHRLLSTIDLQAPSELSLLYIWLLLRLHQLLACMALGQAHGHTSSEQAVCCDSARTPATCCLSVALYLQRMNDLTLAGCLRRYVRPERLGAAAHWRCSACGSSTAALKQLSFRRLPLVLCFHVKRFEHGGAAQRPRKLDVPMRFPLHGLDMAPFTTSHMLRGVAHAQHCKPACNSTAVAGQPGSSTGPAAAAAMGVGSEDRPSFHQSCLYELFGVVSHWGDMSSGHYVSYIKCDGAWYLINDPWVVAVSEADVAGVQAYMLFYAQEHLFGTGSDGELAEHQRRQRSEAAAAVVAATAAASAKAAGAAVKTEAGDAVKAESRAAAGVGGAGPGVDVLAAGVGVQVSR